MLTDRAMWQIVRLATARLKRAGRAVSYATSAASFAR
jgi:hypothetical protein